VQQLLMLKVDMERDGRSLSAQRHVWRQWREQLVVRISRPNNLEPDLAEGHHAHAPGPPVSVSNFTPASPAVSVTRRSSPVTLVPLREIRTESVRSRTNGTSNPCGPGIIAASSTSIFPAVSALYTSFSNSSGLSSDFCVRRSSRIHVPQLKYWRPGANEIE